MDVTKLTEEKLDINEVYSLMVSHSAGAVSLFIGTTRDHFEDKKVLKLEYEAFIPMAEKELKKICRLIREKWKVEHIAFYHRLGIVPVGEASVIVAVSSVHRAESLEAVQFGIDTLKQSVPIWKKEVYEEGTPEWKANKECQWSSNAEETSRKRKMEHEAAEYVQIKASNAELERRISAFIQRKRSESDIINIQEFCHRLPLEETQNSCARTEAVLVCRKDSKSHLKVSRCVNTSGPQTSTADSVAVPGVNRINAGVQERLENMEKHLGLSKKDHPVPQDVYARLKALEDRILYLESTSPEYFNDASRTQGKKEEDDALNKIDQRMEELKRQLGLVMR